MKNTMHFPKAVYAERKRLGITQIQLAERLGVNKQTIWRWESGLQLPPEHMQALFLDAIKRLK
jgi:transcriptional regulator with XRE-family HTH domain